MRGIVTAGVVMGVRAFGAPPATAAHAVHGCDFVAASEDGEHYEGHLYGYVVSALPGEPVTLSCRLMVGGGTVFEVEREGGQSVSVSTPVAYDASELTWVDLCYDWRAGTEYGTTCRAVTTMQVPSQLVRDEFASLLLLVTDIHRGTLAPALCPVLRMLAPGVPGVVDITPDGTVYVAGQWVWGCGWYDQPAVELPERMLTYSAGG